METLTLIERKVSLRRKDIAREVSCGSSHLGKNGRGEVVVEKIETW